MFFVLQAAGPACAQGNCPPQSLPWFEDFESGFVWNNGWTRTTLSLGCCADTTLTFGLQIRSIWFPNVFTPDEDGNNRFGCVTSCEVSEYELMVFNRWGLWVWSTTDINNRWDGCRDERPLPQGAYVYRWRLKDVQGERWHGEGIVTLIR